MLIKINFMHFIKWTRVMLPVLFEKFKAVCIFLCYFFLFIIIANWEKVSFCKNLGEGRGAAYFIFYKGSFFAKSPL